MEQTGARTEELLRQGVAAAKAKRRTEAYALLTRVVQSNPRSEQGWLWLAAVAPTPEESVAAFSRVLELNPGSEQAQIGREWATKRMNAASGAAAPTKPAAPPPAAPPPPLPPVDVQASALSDLPAAVPTQPPRRPVVGTALLPDVVEDKPATTPLRRPVVGTGLLPPEPVAGKPPLVTDIGAPRRPMGTAPLSPDVLEGRPAPTGSTTPRRPMGTAPLSPDVLEARAPATVPPVPPSELTVEQWPQIQQPLPRTPTRPGPNSPVWGTTDRQPEQPPAAPPADHSTRPVNLSAPNSMSIAPAAESAAPDEWQGLDVLLPRADSFDWGDPTGKGSVAATAPSGEKIICPNCSFANEPGAIVCARCSTLLPRADAPISVAVGPRAAAPPLDLSAPAPAATPHFITPIADPERRGARRAGLLPLLLGVLVVLVGLALAVYGLAQLNRGNTPEDVAKQFFEQHLANNAGAARSLLTAQLAATYATGDVAGLAATYPRTQSWTVRTQPYGVASDNSQAQVLAFIEPVGSKPNPAAPAYVVYLINSGGKWLIDALNTP